MKNEHGSTFPLKQIARFVALTLSGPMLGAIALPAFGQATMPTVEVIGEARERVPATRVTEDIEAMPASTTVLQRAELDRLTISTYGDMFRNITGATVNEYNQGLVAYEIKMRGFGSGHGRDLAFTLDGVPLNITGSQHTNGFADLAQVIAETISRVEVIRGPFSVTAGNHAVGGSVNLFTDRNTPSMVKLDVDSFGRVRVVPILSTALGPGRVLVALDATKGDSYQDQTGLRRTNILTRYSMPIADGQASVRLQHYDADAEAAGYIDYASVLKGAISPRAALAPGIGDTKKQTNLVMSFRSDDAEGAGGMSTGWQSSIYTVRDDRRRYSYYDLSNPIGKAATIGGELDELRQSGLNLSKATMLGSVAMPAQLLVGLQYNNESIDAIHFRADSSRQSLGDGSVDALRDVKTRTTALYTQYQVSPMPGLKLHAGLRYDRIEFDVKLKPLDDSFSSTGSNAVSDTKSQLSPKLGVAYALTQGPQPIEIFANAARGLKTPYPYGDYNKLPDSTITPLDSYELGIQSGNAQGGWRLAAWTTKQQKEALFNSANQFIGNQRTDRKGIDAEGRYAISKTMKIATNFSVVEARVLGQGGNDRISNVPDWTAGLGIEGMVNAPAGRFDWSLNDSIVGPQPLVADNSARTKTYNRLTARAAYAPTTMKNSSFSLTVTGYDRVYEETRFDFGGGQFGVSPKSRWKALASVQYGF